MCFDRNWRQTAIGTKLTPGFNNVFMRYFEEQFLDFCRLKPLGLVAFFGECSHDMAP